MAISQEYFKYLKHFSNTVSLQNYFLNAEHRDLVALRHDVDYSLDCALEMAFWENREGFQSTYFLLHTADYWGEKDFIDKVLQLQDFGHEVGLHNNLIASWFTDLTQTPERSLQELLDCLRQAGVDVVGTSAHGDGLCYKHQFINYWVFSDLRPENPVLSESGLNAEGIPSSGDRNHIGYPGSHKLTNKNGDCLELWSILFENYGLTYEAAHLTSDGYYSDSGGAWNRTRNPLEDNLSVGRHQVLVHPEHWQGPKKLYFFLSTARSGSTWLTQFLDKATSLNARHEFTLNHRYARESQTLCYEKRTGHGFNNLVGNKEEVRQLCVESRNWSETLKGDYAEANVYLERVLPVLNEVFPEATLVHLHRDPKDVVRSLMNRDWYNVPGDSKYPVMEVPFWSVKSQFEKICWYVRLTNESLLEQTDKQVAFGEMINSPEYLTEILSELGIAVYPRLALPCHNSVVNANKRSDFPSIEKWSRSNQLEFWSILRELIIRLGYENLYADISSEMRGNNLHFSPLYFGESIYRLFKLLKPRRFNIVESLVSADIDFSNTRSVPHLFPVRCAFNNTEQGLMLTVDRSSHNNAYCVINGNSWAGIKCNLGWKSKIGTYISGEIDVEIEDDGDVQLFALMYDRKGSLIGKKSIVVLNHSTSCTEFSFRNLNEASRFCFAFYFSAQSSPSKLLVRLISFKSLVG